MLLNKDVVIRTIGSEAVLVPYSEEHVSQYHKWMQSEELLQLTASDPLTLSEEQENMHSWRNDERKMTFIILDASMATNYMAGDVNLYILEDDEDGMLTAEIEVMIAEPCCRRKGLAKSALHMMMAYAEQNLGIQVFVAKILEHNLPSIALFTNVMHFKEERRVAAFGEVHYRLEVDGELNEQLDNVRKSWYMGSFTNSSYSQKSNANDE